jgi:hypothetical protein
LNKGNSVPVRRPNRRSEKDVQSAFIDDLAGPSVWGNLYEVVAEGIRALLYIDEATTVGRPVGRRVVAPVLAVIEDASIYASEGGCEEVSVYDSVEIPGEDEPAVLAREGCSCLVGPSDRRTAEYK